MTKSQRKKFIKDTFTDTQVGVILEDMSDGIKVIGEQHGDIIKKIDNLNSELKEKIDDNHLELNKKIDDFRNETKANFKAINEFLSRIDDEYTALRGKVGMLELSHVKHRDFEWIRNKVLDLEKKLKECQRMQKSFASRA